MWIPFFFCVLLLFVDQLTHLLLACTIFSGLDSTSAVALVHMLQQLARTQNKTVITSIHQPNSALFRSFDKIIMLGEGNVVYFGTPRASLNYLKDQSFSCPDGYNGADHWMDLLVRDSAIDESSTTGLDVTDLGMTEHSEPSSDEAPAADLTFNTGLTKGKSADGLNLPPREQLIRAWDNEAVAEQMDLTVDRKGDNDETDRQMASFSKYNTSWGAQYRVLVHRSLKNSRSAIFTPVNLLKSAALGLVTGLLWFQMDYTESTVFDRSSYFFFTMTYWVFDAMFTALMAFPAEREVILKERSSGSYHLSAYFLAKTSSEMPTRLVLPAIYMVISFWMAGVSDRFDLFLFTTFITLLSVVAGEAIGLMIGASVYDMEKAMTIMTVVALALMLLGGFFVENVPFWLEWGKYISPFKYSFDASRQLVFDRDVPCDGSGALLDLCGGSSEGFVAPEEIIDFLAIQGSVGFNIGLLLVIGLVPRFVAYLALRSKKEGDR
jgi:ABC-type multidrug transport system permease subunit